MKHNRKKYRQIIFLALSMFLMGCASVELEERSFPLVVAVGYEDRKVSYVLGFTSIEGADGKTPVSSEIPIKKTREETFLESKQAYESHLNKFVDYNHLKVLVLEEEVLKESNIYNEMLDVLAKGDTFPRNTYVCVVDDVEDLMEMEKALPQDLGTYLEEYLTHHEAKDGHRITLGDLIDEKENKLLALYLPYLEVEDTFVVWDGYYVVDKNTSFGRFYE